MNQSNATQSYFWDLNNFGIFKCLWMTFFIHHIPLTFHSVYFFSNCFYISTACWTPNSSSSPCQRQGEITEVRKVRVSNMMFSEHNNVTESGEVFNWGLWDNAYDAHHQQGWRGDYTFQDAFFCSNLHTVASESNFNFFFPGVCLKQPWSSVKWDTVSCYG